MTKLRNFCMVLMLITWSSNQANGQDMTEFVQKIQDIYGYVLDTAKAGELARDLFQTLETDKSNMAVYKYQMLLPIFENLVKDPVYVDKCRKKAGQTNAPVASTSSTSASPLDEWNNNYYPKLFTTDDPDNAQKALTFLEANSTIQNFNAYNYVAYAFENNGDYPKAKKQYERALSFVKDEQTNFYSFAYYTNFLSRSGEYLKAETFMNRIEKLSQSTSSYIQTSYHAESLTTRTVYYSYIGDFDSYIEASKKQYEYFDTLHDEAYSCNPNPMTLSTITAHSYELMGAHHKAKPLWQQRDAAYNDWITCHNSRFPESKQLSYSVYPIYLSKTGALHEIDKPLEFYIDEVLKYYGNFEKYATVNVRNYKAQHLGFLFAAQYHSVYERLLEDIKDRRDFTEATLPFANYGYFCSRDGLFEKAYQVYNEMFELNGQWINDLISTFGEKAFVTYYNTKIKAGYDNFHSFVKILNDRSHPLFAQTISQDFNNVLMTKSIGFKGTQKKKALFLKSNDKDVRELYDQWIAKKKSLINYYQKTENKDKVQGKLVTENEAALKVLQEEVDMLENRLAEKARDFKKYLKVDQPNWQDIRSRLKENEAAIEMIRFNWRDQIYYSDSAYYAAYIIRKESTSPEVVYLPTMATDLEGKFHSGYKNSIKLKLEDNRSFEKFWEPIQKKLNGIEKVYFSPDGIYHLINLPTLKNPNTSKYLLEELQIQYVTTTAGLLEKPVIDIKTTVLIGRPKYNLDEMPRKEPNGVSRSFVRNFRGQNISDLPGTEEEIRSINNVLKSQDIDVKYYVKESATEGEVYNVSNPDILHIATHGYWSSIKNSTPGYRMFNAMVNSGLLLAGVVNYYSEPDYPYTHDGILTAYEAQNLNLEGTELVILSACETGLGDFDAGEGVYGLQRAFRSAGAKSVVTSLWKVDDEATRDFMIHFYEALFSSGNKLDAFRLAQIEIKEKYIHPYYWGAFVLSGI